MKTALILKVESEKEFNGWKTMLPMMAGGNKEAVLIIGYPEDSGTKANYSRSGLKVVKIPYVSIMSMNNQLRGLLGNDEYDIVFEHGLEKPELYLDRYTTVKTPKEAIDILKSMNSQKKPDSPSPQPAPKKKEEPKEKAKGNKNKKKKAKEEKTEEKKEKEEEPIAAPPGVEEEKKEEKAEKKEEAKGEAGKKEKEEEIEVPPEKEEAKGKESAEEKRGEEKKEKDEGDEKEKEKKEEKEQTDKKEEKKEEKQITYVFDPYTQENYKYLYPKKYTRTTSNSDDMQDWKNRWFGEQVYVSRLALMQAAWIICEVFQVGEISSDDAMQVIQLIMRCRGYEDFNSSASNVLSNDKLRFNVDKNDPTSQEVAVAYFERLSHVASWYTTLSRLLTEKIQISE